MTKKRITLERTFDSPVEDVWELWTTKDGIESWWGPDGFRVEVLRLDLRPGGELDYAMICTGPEQMEFMKKAGMPLIGEHRISYTEVKPRERLVYTQKADFIPGVEPYDVGMMVELHPTALGVRMVLTIDAMHDEHWTKMAVMGWESELAKLAKVLERNA
ncbi:MAG TPA: SRPBCC domain-containing protein [Polyangiaceae bacterium]|nr:SRPBCC domain-containing protein [Polyangiaceae bacterium]